MDKHEDHQANHGFDKDYWEQHWRDGRDGGLGSMGGFPPNPHLVTEIGDLAPGTALDAGCGGGAEAIWLAEAGWQVTGADISSVALASAAERAASSGVGDRVSWVEADLSAWVPDERFDLVTTHYAHPATPQLDFYERIAEWVAAGGTLLIIGHLSSGGHGHDHGHDHGDDGGDGGGYEGGGNHPKEATATPAGITKRLGEADWEVITADERHRVMDRPGDRAMELHDVVVRATRRR